MDENIKKQIQLYKKAEKDPYFLKELSVVEAKEDNDELFERFYTDLEFGTGGIRGIIEAGTNRLNTLVVQRVAEGWARFLRSEYPDIVPSVVIAYDSRNFSDTFSRVVSEVLTAHGVKVYCYTNPRPTPQLSYSIRILRAQSGMVITASHNPPKYNGIKIYGEDGAQVIAPQDAAIMKRIEDAKKVSDFPSMQIEEAEAQGLYVALSEEYDAKFQEYVSSVLLQKELFTQADGFKVVYTPLHGTGAYHMQELMSQYGIEGVIEPSQKEPDGSFHTVKFPNPEDPAALANAIDTAKKIGAQLVVATDPDADRVGLAERHGGEFVCLTGNQTGALLLEYILQIKKDKNLLAPHSVFVNTIVTTTLQEKIAAAYGIETHKTYTGFKNIAQAMANIEKESKHYAFSCEESYGYLASMNVRDKDGISISMLCIEMAKYYHAKGSTLTDRLAHIFRQYGYHHEKTLNVVLEGSSGKEKIQSIMKKLRENPPTQIVGERVVKTEDYDTLEIRDGDSQKIANLDFPSTSNVLVFTTETGNMVCMRPSGTEPKIKFYCLYQHAPVDEASFVQSKEKVEAQVLQAEKELGAWIG